VFKLLSTTNLDEQVMEKEGDAVYKYFLSYGAGHPNAELNGIIANNLVSFFN
jgi:hypothetical protein